MKNLRLLIVEDSPQDAELLLWELRTGGYDPQSRRVQTREDLRQALAESWDIVISDYSMPGFDGLQALALVRELRPHLPFIMVSGTIGEELAVRAMRAGASDYLMKGSIQRLSPAVERELREARSREEKETAQKALRLTQFSLDRSSELMMWLNQDGGFVHSNRATARLLGYSRKEILDLRIWDVTPEWNPERFRTDWSELRLLNSMTMESGARAKDGSRLDVEVAVSFVPFAGEECAFVLMRDVTEKKRAEEALRKSEEQLRQAQRMETVGRLAGGIAHDFNNILAVVTGYSSLLQTKLARNGTSFRELIEIEKAAIRASNLVRQLLTFSRRQLVKPQVLDLALVVQDSLPMLNMVLGASIRLDTRFQPDAGRILADRSQMEQIIMNLVVNARDAMPKGGELFLEVVPEALDKSDFRQGEARVPGDYVCLRVRDTGCGMSAETVSRVFEPFYTTKGESGGPGGRSGTGLGLSTVYGIVQQNKAVIRVESAPQQGTTFSLFFPATLMERREEPAAQPISNAMGHGETILLVEDDVDLRKLTKDILVMEGYSVMESHTHHDALGFARAADLRIDLLLTDLVMPEMNGRDLAAAVLNLRPGLKVMFMSGYAPEFLTPEAGTLPDLLEKPFTPGQLLSQVRGALDAPLVEKQL